MRHTLILRISALACLVSLGGCQFLGQLNLARSGSEKQQKAAPAQRAVASSLAEGRDHLRANRNGMAIESFNLALVRGEDPAAAFNGLGVAYARVGRNDLAYRFFKKANASDPDNPIYASNLIRLVDQPSFALNQIDRTPAAQPPRQADRPASASAAAPRTPGKLYREGRGQLSLVTRPDPAAASHDPRSAMALPRVAVRTAIVRAPAAAGERSAVPSAAEPAAITPNVGKRKVIQFAPVPADSSKAGQTSPARSNAAS